MMNKLILISLFLLLTSFCYGANDSFVFNSTDLPLNFTTNLTLNFVENEFVYVTLNNSVDFIDVSFNEKINFTNSSEVFYFNFTINKKVILENKSYNISFVVNNSKNNITSSYDVFIKLIHNDPAIEDRSIMEVIEPLTTNGTYAERYSTNTLPLVKKYEYKLKGISGNTVYIDCKDSEILTCPSFKIFDSNNLTSFFIESYLPFDYPIGVHEEIVEFRTNNITIQKKIIYEIVEADILFKNFVFNETCFKKIEGEDELAVTLDCLDKQQEFLIRQTQEYIEKIRTGLNKDEYCKDFIKFEDKFVVVGNISKDNYDELKSCRELKSDCEVNYNDLRVDYSSLLDKYHKNESDVVKEAINLIDKNNGEINFAKGILQDEVKKLEDERDSFWNGVIKFVCWSLVIVIFILLCLYIYMNRSKEVVIC